MEKLTDGVKKIFLAGIGAVATTVEKGQDVVKDLVEKGELTVEQGKTLNEELKHKLHEPKDPKAKASSIIDSLSEEELDALKQKINEQS